MRTLTKPSGGLPIGLSARAIVAGWVLLLVVVAGGASAVFHYFSHAIERRAESDLQTIALSAKRQMEAYVGERFQDAHLLARRAPLWQTLDATSGPVLAADLEDRLAQALEQTRQAYGYRAITLFDRSLQRRASTAAAPEALQSAEAQAFESVLAQGRRALVDMHLTPGCQPCFGVAEPVFARGEAARGVVGVLYLEVDAAAGLYPRVLTWPGATETTEAFLLGIDGADLVYLSPLRFRPGAPALSVRRPVGESPYALAGAVGTDAPRIVHGPDYRGEPVVGAAVAIAATPWFVVVKVDRAEASGAIVQLRDSLLAGSAVLAVLLALGGRLLWRAKQAEDRAARLALDARYTAARQTSMDGYLVADHGGRLLEVNEALVGMTGYSREELCQRCLGDLCPPDAREDLLGALATIRQSGAGRLRTQWLRKDASVLELQISATYLADASCASFQAFVRDRGPELADLQRIQRLQTFYVFLSHVNAAIFKLHSEQDILDAVCEGAVREGGFILAWAGTLDEAQGRVLPVSASGVATDYVRQLVITTDPALPTSHGPTRMSMVDGSIQFTDDFQNDARTQPWHALGLEHGIHASAAVPVVVSGKAVAALTFYAGARNFFDADMRALLQETARYVSLAFQAVEAEQARDAAAQAHRASEARFARMFEASPVPMQIVSFATRRVRAINRAYHRTFGYTLDDIPDEATWFEKVYPDPQLRQQLVELWNNQSLPQARAGGDETVVSSPEITLRCRDGSDRIVRGYMSLVGDDVVVQWEDLTGIKQAEAKLAQDEQRFRGLIEQTLTGIYVTQHDRIVYVNPRFCELVGWSREEMLGHDSLEVVATTPQARDIVLRERKRVAAGEHGDIVVVPLRSKSGELIELGLQANMGTWNGEPALVVMALDVSERRRAEKKIAAYVKQLEGTMRGTLQAVANMVELRDPYTSGHERRVGLIAADIAREMGWSEEQCQNLQLIGLVHDIGKIAVPAEILSKPTRLTQLEYEMIKSHAEKGYEILKDVEFPVPIAEIIREHHERMDGSGYPQGLKGDQIRPEARILAVADVLESMASHRPYRPALGLEAALREIEGHRGQWFDADVVDAALRLTRRPGYQLPT